MLEPHEVCLTSGTDLREFYHSFSASHSRLVRNSLLVSAWSWEVRDFQCYDSSLDHFAGRVFFGLRTLAMGDTCAVELAQTAHIGILTQLGVLQESNMISMNAAIPRSPSLIGVVIDDLVFLERIGRSLLEQGQLDGLRSGDDLDSAIARYTELGLIPHPDKTFKYELQQEFWVAFSMGTKVWSEPL